jgi:peptidoglycan hydrolase-like protein with peptidoglycan-binding domain
MAHDANGKWVGYSINDTGPQVIKIQHRLLGAYPKNSQAITLGVTESGTYDQATFNAVANIQPFFKLPSTGIADFATQRALGATVDTPVVPPKPAHRPIWFFNAPGSGADWNMGPSFDLGETITGNNNPDPTRQSLNINTQPLGFIKGGYLGLLGGDPTYSYVDVTYDEYLSLLNCLDTNPDVQAAYQARLADPNAVVELEMWMSGYSQSADGMEDALEILFGDGGFTIPKTGEVTGVGKYRILRDRINGLVQFGNPSKKTTGIARKVRPDWLDALIHNIFYDNDFYAMVPASDVIRPDFYAIIVEANISLPFFVHVLKIAVPVVLGYIPILGMFGPLAQAAVAAMAGLTNILPLFGSLMGQAGTGQDDAVDAKLEALLQPMGILENIPGLITLLGALPGLQAHGNYPFDPDKMNEAYDVIASFRR